MKDKFKPCPFCGGKAEMRSGFDVKFLRCEKCGASAGGAWQNEKQAITSWNTRHIDLDGLEDVIEKLKTFRWACVDCYENKSKCWYGIYEEDFKKLATAIREYLKGGRSENKTE